MAEVPEKQLEHIFISVSSRWPEKLDKVTDDIVAVAKGMQLKVLGPFSIPPKIVNITSRLAPCPDGTNLRGNFKLRIYENLIEVFSSTEVVKQITAGPHEWNVKIDVTVGVRGGSSKQGQVGESFLSQLPRGSEKQLQQINIRMSSRRLPILNKVNAEFVAVAKGMHLKVLGPTCILRNTMNITTRLAPGPDGTNRHGNFKVRGFENSVEVFSTTEVVEQIISRFHEWDVEIEIIFVAVRVSSGKQDQVGVSVKSVASGST